MDTSKGKIAFITGITGQDGSYLTEILLEKGYQVHGLIRPSSHRRQALNHPVRPGITLHYGDMTDSGALVRILKGINADEIYHLAAQSHVGISFENPLSTCDINALGSLRLLEAVRLLRLEKKVKFYSAVTSELFGNDTPAPQTEATPFHPVSPYAISKLFQYMITVNFRDAYGIHASNGILFNHESPRRGTEFVTRKITTQVALIACGLAEEFELGNLNATRDWGHARDYMEGVWMMLQQPQGGDYVLATGQTTSVRQFVESAFNVVGIKVRWTGEGITEKGIDCETGKVLVRVNPKFYRPVENHDLLGSAEKARNTFGWEPKHTLNTLVEEMVLADLELVKNGKIFSDTYLDWLVDQDRDINSPSFVATQAITWAADESESALDSAAPSGKASDWSGTDSESTQESITTENEQEKPQTALIAEKAANELKDTIQHGPLGGTESPSSCRAPAISA